ncbi:MAG: glycosyltransferase family 4 protein [Chloroflexi bacterium]|jgi:glycosyltransferase involved in cell wall biosynthesis|nr:glycosyltransferase family 4 protein [Chloroflexota bacterium]
MRIRHILPQLAMGNLPEDPQHAALTGIVATAWSLAAQQAALGHEVEIIAPGQQGSSSRTIAGVRVRWLAPWASLNTPRYDLSFLAPLWLFMLRARPADVTHVHGNPYFLPRLRTRARVLHVQDLSIQPSPQMNRAVARADRIICCSHFVRHKLIETVSYPPERIGVVPNGADAQVYAQISRASARAALALSDNHFVMLYVGRIGPEKGLLVLIEALNRLTAQRETGLSSLSPLLLVAGSATLGFEGYPAAWQDRQTYEQQVRQRAQGLPVRFLGAVPRAELPALYRAADVFVCPSVYEEPLGMVNIEAAAAGVPVIASAVGGIPDAVAHGKSGLLVPPGDAQALAEALLHLMYDTTLCRQMGSAAQDLAVQFDWRVLAGRVMDIYAQALQGAPTASFQ